MPSFFGSIMKLMPELPEVETVRSGLEELISNVEIKKVEILYPKLIESDKEKFIVGLTNHRIMHFNRRGKYLLFELDNKKTLVSHLRMEGQYSVEQENQEPYKHTELILWLSDRRKVFYNDTRRFGKMQLVDAGKEIEIIPGLQNIGPEPTSKELKIGELFEKTSHSNRMIKTFLLDQKNIAGIGNIYADEVLWQSKIHPERLANSLSYNEVTLLRKNIIQEIKRAIKWHGTTVHSFSNVFGETGKFQNKLDAYDRKGLPCRRCGTPLSKIKVGQRGSTFCSFCQQKELI